MKIPPKIFLSAMQEGVNFSHKKFFGGYFHRSENAMMISVSYECGVQELQIDIFPSVGGFTTNVHRRECVFPLSFPSKNLEAQIQKFFKL
jgi:hypothetical protein